jgi:hypothetical protein
VPFHPDESVERPEGDDRLVGGTSPVEDDRRIRVVRGRTTSLADWAAVWPRLGLLPALAAAMAYVGTRAFGRYQRSL